MFRQIIVAMAGAIAAQLTAATLDFSPADRREHVEPHPAAIRLAVIPGMPQDFFAGPAGLSSVVPFLGPPQTPEGN